MSKKQMIFKTKGMNKDLSVSAFNPEFSFENRNLRLSTNEGNTTLSWVNEKGTKAIDLLDNNNEKVSISGYPIGTAVINHILVLFTTTNNSSASNPRVGSYTDYIYAISNIDGDVGDATCTLLFSGNLNFYTHNPLERWKKST